MAHGLRRKAEYLVRKTWPRDAWPEHVPYPNVIALNMCMRERMAKMLEDIDSHKAEVKRLEENSSAVLKWREEEVLRLEASAQVQHKRRVEYIGRRVGRCDRKNRCMYAQC
jgi:hypothetical protein